MLRGPQFWGVFFAFFFAFLQRAGEKGRDGKKKVEGGGGQSENKKGAKKGKTPDVLFS